MRLSQALRGLKNQEVKIIQEYSDDMNDREELRVTLTDKALEKTPKFKKAKTQAELKGSIMSSIEDD